MGIRKIYGYKCVNFNHCKSIYYRKDNITSSLRPEFYICDDCKKINITQNIFESFTNAGPQQQNPNKTYIYHPKYPNNNIIKKIEQTNIKIGTELGKGKFGSVFKGEYTNNDNTYDVAIKIPSDKETNNDIEYEVYLLLVLDILLII